MGSVLSCREIYWLFQSHPDCILIRLFQSALPVLGSLPLALAPLTQVQVLVAVANIMFKNLVNHSLLKQLPMSVERIVTSCLIKQVIRSYIIPSTLVVVEILEWIVVLCKVCCSFVPIVTCGLVHNHSDYNEALGKHKN